MNKRIRKKRDAKEMEIIMKLFLISEGKPLHTLKGVKRRKAIIKASKGLVVFQEFIGYKNRCIKEDKEE